MNEKTAFLGLISLPQCTIEQLLDLRENPRLDDSPSPTSRSQQRGTICLSVLIDHLTFLGKPDWLGFLKKYSWGGEDGLNETPVVNANSINDMNKYYGMPSWNVWSILSQYQFQKNIILNVALKNIFDLHYRTFASGISAEGRSIQLGLKVKI